MTPILHGKVLGVLYDPYHIPLAICKYITAKNSEAVLAWIYLIIQPLLTSRIIPSTEIKAKSALAT